MIDKEKFFEPPKPDPKYKNGVPEDNNDYRRKNTDKADNLRIRTESGDIKSWTVHKFICAHCGDVSWGCPAFKVLIKEVKLDRPGTRIHGQIVKYYDEICNFCDRDFKEDLEEKYGK